MNFTDLKAGRLAKGWSQVEAAGRLKVSQSYLAMLRGLQNRLGFGVTLARRLAERAGDQPRARTLEEFETVLERSRLARENTLCRASLPEAEQRWLVEHRSPEAKRWNVLSDWTADALRFA